MASDPRTYRIIGSAMAIHRKLGSGFLEAVYQDALAVEFERVGIPFRREVPFPVVYEGRTLGANYRVDFVCFDEVIVEVKAHGGLVNPDVAQVVNYLRASGLQTGLLLNFGLGSLQYRRFIFTQPTRSAPIARSNADSGGAETPDQTPKVSAESVFPRN